MSEFVLRFRDQIAQMPREKQRIVGICLVGAMLIGIVSFLGSSEETTATISSPPVVVKASQPVVKPVSLPLSANAHDPFAIPEGFEAKSADKQHAKPPELPPGFGPQTQQFPLQPTLPAKEVVKEALPVLSGVINGGGEDFALLNYNGISRSYRVGQDIGPYRLVSIERNSATVSGPAGQRVLTLGR